jgi:endo-1,3(4)-beta-glucanase
MQNWIEGLIRDSNNPSIEDKNFPQFRSFDWFTGHSWSQV